ncbi:lipopolysaccharide biosynthesis protein [uncultured Senegalimassilia sp.]|uniref:lipopolysaccharide biosynthesis protein n=1 Tax=uncultured Senegalimassilia sp. TaxID=1714350 RepID=UPI002676B800|nr:hypothetical protein [uncultured Senegalimassilia sp.]
MNNFEHTEPPAQGKHGTQRPDLQRVRVDAPRSPYRNTPRSAAQHASAQQVAQPAAQQATTPLPGRHAAQPTAAMPGRHTAQGARNAQPTATIPGHQQPTAALPADSTHAMPDGKRKRGRGRKSRRGDAPRKKSFLSRQVEAWCTRVLGAVNDGSLAEQEAEYASGRTARDFAWNTIGVGLWGCVFPVLTIVVTQLAGAEQAGMFSLAFVTALLLMFVGNYGMRNFQASDLDEEYSFADYQANRVLTCVIMLVAGLTYCNIRGYTDQMWLMSLGVYLYKMVDALADVYEGRLQQKDKLYLAGMSQAFRSAAALIGFTFALLITRNVGVSSIVMAVVAAATFVVFTFPLAKLETPKSRRVNVKRVVNLLVQCFPLFVALFMYNLIDNMPKFVMEGALSYDNQLYYNALYFPAHAILLTSGFIYKPMLLKMANAWADPAKRKKFDLIIVVMFVVIVGITATMAGIMGWFGLTIMSFLYGIDFEPYRGLCFVMLAAGGVTAGIEFLYQVITVLRRQRAVTKLYLITFGFSLLVPILLVNFTGLPGAVIGYLIVMCILLVLLVSEYASIRMNLRRKLTGKSAPDAEMPRAARTGAMAPVQVAGAGEQAAAGVVPQAAVAPMQAQAMAGSAVPQAAGVPMRAPAAQQATAAQVQRAAAQQAVAPISWTAGGTVGIAQPEPEAPEPGGGSEDESGNA